MTTFAEQLISAPHVKLTDTAWDEIAHVFKLPIEARHSINCAVSFFEMTAKVQLKKYSPATTKKSLRDLADLTSKLRGGIQELLGHPLAIVALNTATSAPESLEIAMNHKAAQHVLAVEIAALDQLEGFLRAATENVVQAEPGSARRALRIAIFVKALDEIMLQFTGRHLRRDSKGHATGRDFVAAVSNAADLKIKPGSIDEALKQVVKGRGGISGRTAR
jgi:hypothetical protein